MVKCVCFDDTKKPSVIPQENWVKSGDLYHITHVYKMMPHGGLGFLLHEVSLEELHEKGLIPYNCYKAERFIIPLTEMNKFIELMEMCAELTHIDIDKLMKQLVEDEEICLNTLKSEF